MARLPVAPLPLAPDAYDSRHINELIRTLNFYFRQLQNPGPIVTTDIQITRIPTSSTGLRAGQVWHDTADNTLKIVPTTEYFVYLVGTSATAAAGTVTP